jgi:hypothetical protein
MLLLANVFARIDACQASQYCSWDAFPSTDPVIREFYSKLAIQNTQAGRRRLDERSENHQRLLKSHTSKPQSGTDFVTSIIPTICETLNRKSP